ncbi:enoyl-CoA hydratase-related protein [[Mycobacterium] nativiensis]|uniref:Enoyl-CoA hydratase-related protein n=1 Tax=[Mycobacterium] nativiensis TaxID=2855503 RepID=A0ABU5XYU7_9MYCO|nr:enoyl-CoA hydratase-related protein [Mycolicibacter sp. MYC340]MEB3031865.1 enoyl-CoA hydratase-related protein [Mycolicibacter sp. MYC340]
MTEPHEPLIVARSGGVVTVTLNRPDRKNAINGAMWRALTDTFTTIRHNSDDRVVVIAGAGGAFCSGQDVADLGARNEAFIDGASTSPPTLFNMYAVNRVALDLHHMPKPTIAKVDGVAAGAGANLALGCDLVVASDRARFTQIFAQRGLSLDFGGSWLLPRLVGLQKAKELAFFGDAVDADEAAALGLVNRVVLSSDLDAAADEWANRLAAGPTVALSMIKKMLNHSVAGSMDDALEDEARCQHVSFSTADMLEAVAAFLQRRPAKFTGR